MRTRFTYLGALLLTVAAVAPQVQAQERSSIPSWSMQKSTGEVTLDVTPEWTSKGLVVKLSANTHSVELGSLNLSESVRLYVGDQVFTPEEAGSLGGHHGQASVLFAVPEAPSAFRVEISGVPDVPIRVLKWPAVDSGS